VDENELLAERFEAHRRYLRGVAYRVLGRSVDAEDAVQEAWLRLSHSNVDDVDNLRSWLTTVVARVCLDMLRSRRSRLEEPVGAELPEPLESVEAGTDPEHEAVLADSVGLALLVVLESLAPAERLAFVLHDLFGVPFDEIAPIVDKSPAAARQLASRARRRVQGADAQANPDLNRQRQIVEAWLAASRGGDFGALLALLDPNVVLRIDESAVPSGAARRFQGAAKVAGLAKTHAEGSRFGQLALVNGAVGIVVAPPGGVRRVLVFTFVGEKIAGLDILADLEHLAALDLVRLS